MAKDSYPKEVPRGSVIVKVYKTPSHGFDAYTVVYYIGDKRFRKSFADAGKALTYAEERADKLSNAQGEALKLENHDAILYVRAVDALKPTGVPLDVAAMEYAQAYALLQGQALMDAVRFYVKMHPHSAPRKRVAEVVTELVGIREADGASQVYLKDLRGRLGRFGGEFKGLIGELTGLEVENFLRGLKDKHGKVLSGRSRNNFRRAIGTLLAFAEDRGYIVRGTSPMESVPLAKEAVDEVRVFTPLEMKRILAETPDAMLPFIVLGAFSGIRTAELERLDWREVKLERGHIEIKAKNAKTASRRLVPIAPNLKLWLEKCRQVEGKVCDYANTSKQLLFLSQKVDAACKAENPKSGFTWKRNGLRHSFISYRVAEISDPAKTAFEAGNSVKMVIKNYREVVTPEEAKEWFSITPESVAAFKAQREKDLQAQEPENVIRLAEVAA